MRLRHRAAAGNTALVLLAALLAPFVLLAAFSNPAYDDYGFAITALRQGLLRSQPLWYFSTSGRYFSTAVLLLGPPHANAELQYWEVRSSSHVASGKRAQSQEPR